MNPYQRMTPKAVRILERESYKLKNQNKPQKEYSKTALAEKAIVAMFGDE
jgi:hypothetical protein